MFEAFVAVAIVTTTAPTSRATSTKLQSVGYQFTCRGISKRTLTADAGTVIIDPARIENSAPFATL